VGVTVEAMSIEGQIPGRWLHSHEEDTATEMVFRPDSFSFPLSRGRVGFELRPDGTCVQIGIGPADGPVTSEGHWRIEGDDLKIEGGADPSRHRVYSIVSFDGRRLVVSRA